MALYGIEAVIREVLAVLVAGMPAKLAALAAEYGDGVAPAAPAAEGYLLHVARPLPTPPLIIVLAQPESSEPEGLPSEIPMTYAVQVDVVTRAADPAASTVELWRYWRAVKELLLATNALAVGDCTLRGVDWSQPTITDPDSGDELADIPGVFNVTTYEIA